MWQNILKRRVGGLKHYSKRSLKKIVYLPDTIKHRLGYQDSLVPPKWLRFDSQTDFEEVGEHLLSLCQSFGELTPQSSVLDVGCGVGRLAIPISRFISHAGHYAGFDVDREAIDWCTSAFRAKSANMTFTCVEVANEHYSSVGGQSAAEFRFPYEDECFDLVVATSVFTHLLSDDARGYLKEVQRVLKPEGIALTTWYLVDERILRSPNSKFTHSVDQVSWTDTPVNPCSKMGFDHTAVVCWHKQAGFSGPINIHPGTWVNPEGPTFQDLIVASKH